MSETIDAKAIYGDEVGKVSDGFHTFDELYEFRKIYNAALFNEGAALADRSDNQSL
jgi:hypothetical protein